MACRFPVPAFRTGTGDVVMVERGDIRASLFLPCGRCAMCRLEKSRQWAIRCVHESKLHDASAFITLTYDDAHLPADRSLQYSDYVAFMRRLRKYVRRMYRRGVSTSPTVRFYMCGEYGPTTLRPHYHALIFGFGFPDKLYFKKSGESRLYTSSALGQLWPLGSHLIGEVTFESAAYIARYCMDKVTGDLAESHYRVVDTDTGEVRWRVPEFNQMSRNPGIGAGFFLRFQGDMYPRGEVISRGRKAKAPRYYDKLFRKHGGDVDALAYNRALRAREVAAEESSDERLAVREAVLLARVRQLHRSLPE